MAAKFYSAEFESFWAIYKSPPTSSKAVAYRAWQKADLPPLDLLLSCVEAYNEFLVENKQYRAHAATWLNQSRWDGLLPRAEAILARKKAVLAPQLAATYASRQTWPDDVVRKLGMSEALLQAWIFPCSLVQGNPPQVIAPRKVIQNYLLAKLPTKLERALGPHVVVTCG